MFQIEATGLEAHKGFRPAFEGVPRETAEAAWADAPVAIEAVREGRLTASMTLRVVEV